MPHRHPLGYGREHQGEKVYEIYGYVWDGATREINLGGKPFVLVRYVFALE